jgi:hypothetical protein
MTTEPKVTPQEYYKGFPEAPFSDTFKWTDADGYEHMITCRSWSENSLLQAVDKAKKQIKEREGVPANSKSAVAPAPPSSDGSKAFTADSMEITIKGEKTYCKVKGNPFTQYGVNVWQEVLQAAGLVTKHVEELDPRNPPDVSGWVCFYTEKQLENGKTVPDKIVKMVAPPA